MGLAEGVLAGDGRAVARALSVVERGGRDAEPLLHALRGPARGARTIGITGPPGVGKSSLVERLGLCWLEAGQRVAVLAFDPSSPFSGGALLGDRVRMSQMTARGAFVRSMATRGALGGVTVATADAIDVLAAAGFGRIVVETVGVGQDEVDVAGEVDTVVVVTVAGLGDDVQAAKAGLLEVAHVFAVNKADLPGAEAEVAVLEGMLAMSPPSLWRPPVTAVSAKSGEGVAALLGAIGRHHDHLERDGRRSEVHRQRASRRLERLVAALAWERLRGERGDVVRRLTEQVATGALDPYAAARTLLADLDGGT